MGRGGGQGGRLGADSAVAGRGDCEAGPFGDTGSQPVHFMGIDGSITIVDASQSDSSLP